MNLNSLARRFQTIGLQRRIMIYVAVGLLLFSIIFAAVAVQAIQQSTTLVFRERLHLAESLARQVDVPSSSFWSAFVSNRNSLDKNYDGLAPQIDPLLQAIGADYQVELLDDSGAIIDTSGERRSAISPHWKLVEPFVRAGQSGTLTHPISNGEHVIAFAPLNNLPWTIVVEQSADVAFTLPRQLQNQFFLIGTSAILGGLVLAFITTRRVVQPVNALIQASQEIASGNLDHPLDTTGEAEIGALARSFDEMRVQLKKSIENTRLYAELQEKETARTLLLEKVIEAQEEERKRIARELHDEFAQTLTALTLNLQSAAQSLPDGNGALKQQLVETQSLTAQTLKETSQWILELRPTVLDDLGLVPAIRWYAQSRLESAGTQVQVEARGMKNRLPGSIETALFRIVQEAASNIAKHARAQHVKIQLMDNNGCITVVIEDDGVGFDANETMTRRDSLRGIGLLGMRERAALLGGSLKIESHKGRGTRVCIEVPWKP